MEIRCFRCGEEMIETRITPVGELPKTEDWPISLYIVHPWSMKDCPVADYVIQIGYKL